LWNASFFLESLTSTTLAEADAKRRSQNLAQEENTL